VIKKDSFNFTVVVFIYQGKFQPNEALCCIVRVQQLYMKSCDGLTNYKKIYFQDQVDLYFQQISPCTNESTALTQTIALVRHCHTQV